MQKVILTILAVMVAIVVGFAPAYEAITTTLTTTTSAGVDTPEEDVDALDQELRDRGAPWSFAFVFLLLLGAAVEANNDWRDGGERRRRRARRGHGVPGAPDPADLFFRGRGANPPDDPTEVVVPAQQAKAALAEGGVLSAILLLDPSQRGPKAQLAQNKSDGLPLLGAVSAIRTDGAEGEGRKTLAQMVGGTHQDAVMVTTVAITTWKVAAEAAVFGPTYVSWSDAMGPRRLRRAAVEVFEVRNRKQQVTHYEIQLRRPTAAIEWILSRTIVRVGQEKYGLAGASSGQAQRGQAVFLRFGSELECIARRAFPTSTDAGNYLGTCITAGVIPYGEPTVLAAVEDPWVQGILREHAEAQDVTDPIHVYDLAAGREPVTAKSQLEKWLTMVTHPTHDGCAPYVALGGLRKEIAPEETVAQVRGFLQDEDQGTGALVKGVIYPAWYSHPEGQPTFQIRRGLSPEERAVRLPEEAIASAAAEIAASAGVTGPCRVVFANRDFVKGAAKQFEGAHEIPMGVLRTMPRGQKTRVPQDLIAMVIAYAMAGAHQCTPAQELRIEEVLELISEFHSSVSEEIEEFVATLKEAPSAVLCSLLHDKWAFAAHSDATDAEQRQLQAKHRIAVAQVAARGLRGAIQSPMVQEVLGSRLGNKLRGLASMREQFRMGFAVPSFVAWCRGDTHAISVDAAPGTTVLALRGPVTAVNCIQFTYVQADTIETRTAPSAAWVHPELICSYRFLDGDMDGDTIPWCAVPDMHHGTGAANAFARLVRFAHAWESREVPITPIDGNHDPERPFWVEKRPPANVTYDGLVALTASRAVHGADRMAEATMAQYDHVLRNIGGTLDPATCALHTRFRRVLIDMAKQEVRSAPPLATEDHFWALYNAHSPEVIAEAEETPSPAFASKRAQNPEFYSRFFPPVIEPWRIDPKHRYYRVPMVLRPIEGRVAHDPLWVFVDALRDAAHVLREEGLAVLTAGHMVAPTGVDDEVHAKTEAAVVGVRRHYAAIKRWEDAILASTPTDRRSARRFRRAVEDIAADMRTAVAESGLEPVREVWRLSQDLTLDKVVRAIWRASHLVRRADKYVPANDNEATLQKPGLIIGSERLAGHLEEVFWSEVDTHHADLLRKEEFDGILTGAGSSVATRVLILRDGLSVNPRPSPNKLLYAEQSASEETLIQHLAKGAWIVARKGWHSKAFEAFGYVPSQPDQLAWANGQLVLWTPGDDWTGKNLHHQLALWLVVFALQHAPVVEVEVEGSEEPAQGTQDPFAIYRGLSQVSIDRTLERARDKVMTPRSGVQHRLSVKDVVKASVATAFVWNPESAPGSSTAHYAQQFLQGTAARSLPVNKGSYTPNDAVFTSVNGRCKRSAPPNWAELELVVAAGAMILTDAEPTDYNIGEKELASWLLARGYTRLFVLDCDALFAGERPTGKQVPPVVAWGPGK